LLQYVGQVSQGEIFIPFLLLLAQALQRDEEMADKALDLKLNLALFVGAGSQL